MEDRMKSTWHSKRFYLAWLEAVNNGSDQEQDTVGSQAIEETAPAIRGAEGFPESRDIAPECVEAIAFRFPTLTYLE